MADYFYIQQDITDDVHENSTCHPNCKYAYDPILTIINPIGLGTSGIPPILSINFIGDGLRDALDSRNYQIIAI